MTNILVTGGCGFIGSNFVKHILAKYADYNVINLDSLTYAGNLENLSDVADDARYHFVKGSITDRDLVQALFDQYSFDYVVNFAAESHVDRSIEDPEIFLKTNVLGTHLLLEVAKAHWQIGKDDVGMPIFKAGARFLQVSTDEVYGSLGKTGLFREDTPLSPNSPYSASKTSADLFVRAYYKTFKFPSLITRCSNNYGPYQFPEKLIPLMIANALADKDLPVYGDGMQIRDWLHVKDHCIGIDLVLHKGRLGEVYNIGGNNEKANIEIVKLIIEKLGKSEDLIRYVKDRLGHDRRYAIDNSKIASELGFVPTYTFESGIAETIQWYVENESWWQKIISGEYRDYYEKMYKDR